MDDDSNVYWKGQPESSSSEALSASWRTKTLLFLFQGAFTYATFIFYSSAFFILVPAYNLSVTWTTAVAYCFVTVEIFTTVLVGTYGDRIRSRFGRRKPLVLAGYLVTCVAIALMAQLSVVNIFSARSGDANTDDGNGFGTGSIHSMLVPHGSGSSASAMQIWFFLCEIIAAAGVTIFQVPFNSWFFESTRDNADFSTIQLWCLNLGSSVGYLGGILSLYSFPHEALQWAAMAALCVGLPLLLALLYCVHNRVVRWEGEAAGDGPRQDESARKGAADGRSDVSAADADADSHRAVAKTAPAKEAHSSSSSSSSSSVQHMLPAVRRLFHANPEFRQLLCNEVVLATGAGVATEFISYAPYILFPAIRHYKDLLQLATVFYVGTFICSALLTAVAKPLWLEHYGIDKVRLYRRLIMVFMAGCGVALCINVPGMLTEAQPDTNIGTDDVIAVSSSATSTATTLMYVYMSVQVCLAALFNTATSLSALLTRDLIRFDEYRTGRNQYNLYQAALTVPPKIIVGLLIAVPQIIFYSSGYSSVDYDYSDDASSSNSGSGTFVTDDLIDHKWTWGVASYYEIVTFQCVLAAALAYASYRVLDRYALTQPVADRVDAVLRERRECSEEDNTHFDANKQELAAPMHRQPSEQQHSFGSAGDPLRQPLVVGETTSAGPQNKESELLPWFSVARNTDRLLLRDIPDGEGVGVGTALPPEWALEQELQLFFHLSAAEVHLLAAPDAWDSVQVQVPLHGRGGSCAGTGGTREGTGAGHFSVGSIPNRKTRSRAGTGLSASSASAGDSSVTSAWLEATNRLSSETLDVEDAAGPADTRDYSVHSSVTRGSSSSSSISAFGSGAGAGAGAGPVTYWHQRNTALDGLRSLHWYGLHVAGPVAALLLLYANYVHVWQRTHSPYLPLLVDLLCFALFYIFYEVLRRPVFQELSRVLHRGARHYEGRGIDSNGSGIIQAPAPASTMSAAAANAAGADTLRRALARVSLQLLHRDESLRETLARNALAQAQAAAEVPSAVQSLHDLADPLNCISSTYDPRKPWLVPSFRPIKHHVVREYKDMQGGTHAYSQTRYGGAKTLQELQTAVRPLRAYLVRGGGGGREGGGEEGGAEDVEAAGGSTTGQLKFTYSDVYALWGGYVAVYAGLGTLGLVGCLFIFVI